MAAFLPPAPAYRGPAAHTMKGNNFPLHRIVIHMTVSACIPGAAEETARFFRSPASGGSAHYVVDPVTTLQVVADHTIAEHAPPNPGSIGIEMCGYPESNPVKAWANWNLNPNYRRTLRRASYVAAQLCLAYNIPAHFLQVGMADTDLGITTHNNVSQTFHESTHWDPGVWPKHRFMRQVRKHIRKMKKGKQ